MSGVPLGREWVVDAHGCDPGSLRSRRALAGLFARLVREAGLRSIGPARWRVFPKEGGVTGLLLLTESHLACHTFPEQGFAAFNLYCCKPRAEWPWRERLREMLGARRVRIRVVDRGGSPSRTSARARAR
jgi:S-adenosylmethionine decarboxylase